MSDYLKIPRRAITHTASISSG